MMINGSSNLTLKWLNDVNGLHNGLMSFGVDPSRQMVVWFMRSTSNSLTTAWQAQRAVAGFQPQCWNTPINSSYICRVDQ